MLVHMFYIVSVKVENHKKKRKRISGDAEISELFSLLELLT